jgi:HAE1 family hydrophobic/amphiphilic exporter-1
MGTAIVGGMLTSTLLTLIIVPVVYSLLDDMAAWLRSWFVSKPKLKVMPKPTPATVDDRPAAFSPSKDMRPLTDVPASQEAVSS